MFWFKTLVLWIHLIAVIIWIGGIFFNAIVVTPVLRKRLSSPQSFSQLSASILQRFNRFTKELVGIIILSGIFNLINHGWLINFNFSAAYLQLFSFKMLLVIAIIVLQSIQSLKFIPKWAEIANQKEVNNPGLSGEFEKIRKQINLNNAVSLFLAAVIVLIGMSLKYL